MKNVRANQDSQYKNPNNRTIDDQTKWRVIVNERNFLELKGIFPELKNIFLSELKDIFSPLEKKNWEEGTLPK